MVAGRERPILFSGEMVRALLDGRKTQTRRVVKPQLGAGAPSVIRSHEFFDEEGGHWRCPYGQPGDRLYVRETWRALQRFHLQPVPPDTFIHYEVDGGEDHMGRRGRLGRYGRVRPSIHMPRWASRIDLEVKSVRVERVQDISEEDAIEEGRPGILRYVGAHSDAFAHLWDSINAKRGYSWDLNPWVWVVEFAAAPVPEGGE